MGCEVTIGGSVFKGYFRVAADSLPFLTMLTKVDCSSAVSPLCADFGIAW